MTKETNEIIENIGRSLLNVVDQEKCIEIYFDVELGIESIEYKGRCLKEDGEEKQIDFWDNDYGLPKLFKSLYQTMTADTDKHKWNKAKVTLTNDGKLNIKFEWDQELADELEALEKEYDPRWDDSLTQEEKEKKYKEMVKNGELPDLSKIIIKQ